MVPRECKILITGSNGLVGSALVEELSKQKYTNLVLHTRSQCNLCKNDEVREYFNHHKPDIVFHTAASVFGIEGNLKNQGPIFLDNILINTHVIEASRAVGVKKIIAMGTVAAYPEPKVVPVREENIWEGPPHKSELSYGQAKRAMLAQLMAYKESYGMDYVFVISTNLYGKNDKFDAKFGHVIPSLIRKFYEAKKEQKEVIIWGDGSAARDFLYANDMAKALILLMDKHSGSINVASGRRTAIHEIVEILADYFNMHSCVKWDATKPNGRMYYEVDLTHLNAIGFQPEYNLKESLHQTIDWFCTHYDQSLIRNS